MTAELVSLKLFIGVHEYYTVSVHFPAQLRTHRQKDRETDRQTQQ